LRERNDIQAFQRERSFPAGGGAGVAVSAVTIALPLSGATVLGDSLREMP
jgi:hypothetical protein